jgi:hypothetical protein
VRAFSLAHLTALSLPPPDLIRVAARAGYQSVGLRLLQVAPDTPFYPLMTEPGLMRETRRAIADTGIGVNDIEFIRITPDIDIAGLEAFFAAGAALGARWAVAAPTIRTWAGRPTGSAPCAIWRRGMTLAWCWSSSRGPTCAALPTPTLSSRPPAEGTVASWSTHCISIAAAMSRQTWTPFHPFG